MAKTTALANYDKELAALAMLGASTAKARAGTTAKKIGTKGGRFTIDGKTLKETTIDVVVEDFILLNTFYTPGKKYDAKNPDSPICFGMEREEGDMVAHPDSSAPQGGTKYEPKGGAPGRSCVGCWANEWESAPKGKGKACKNGMRLGLITADIIKSAETIEKSEARFLDVPVMSTRNFSAHEESVRETFSMPVLGVVTTIEIVPGTGKEGDGGGHTLEFTTLQEVDKKIIGPLIAKHKVIAKEINFPFMKPSDAKPTGKAHREAAPARTPAKAAARPSSKGMAASAAAAPAKRATKY